MKKTPLSVIVLTKDEEKNLPGCLQSLRFADQVVVVDSQSSDRTVAIARQAGASVFARPWPGFTAQRNFAISKCRHQWVLSVDADERISGRLAREIGLILEQGPTCEGYRIPEVNNYFGRWLRWGGIYPSDHLILFDRRLARYSSASADVHEGVQLQKTGFLRGHLIHHAYPSIELALEKLNRYTDLEARGRHGQGQRAGVYDLAWRPLERFLKNYIFKAGFLDGPQGLLYCALTAYYSFATNLKIWEIQRQAGAT
jgi:glycosyltransferase involved in cell wall biosynthesis